MVRTESLWQALLLLLLSAVDAARWTITDIYLETVLQRTYTDRYADRTETITTSYTRYTPVTLKPSVTVTVTPVTVYTTTDSSSYYDGSSYVYGGGSDDSVYIQRYYPLGAIPTSDLTSSVTPYNRRDFTSTYFFQTIELTAPASCPTPFTVTTTTQVSVPRQVADQVSITSATTSIATTEYDDDNAYTYTFISAYLASTHHPTGAAATRHPIYSVYMTKCRIPNPTRTSSSGPTSDSSGDSSNQFLDMRGSCAWRDCGKTPYWGVVIVTVLPTICLIGFFESYHWFTCLMSGEDALRGSTVLWILLCLPSIFLTRYIPARDARDQERLRALWAEKTLGQKLSLWRQWGFRHRYPMELLGVHPGYIYGDPAQEGKSIRDLYGGNGNWPQVPPTNTSHAAGQMPAALPQSQPLTPELPTTPRLAGPNSRSVSSESMLPSVPEESGSSTAQAEGKEAEADARATDVEAGSAPKAEDDGGGGNLDGYEKTQERH
ncbi:uncharacterized protein MAM_07756 [Metarhizium album ARSEF 1941]|uniref:Uncharacterized protein n=1 Tax=Metarhizium album (strain ARSEF 1941) TaxID=1081103 RepID=A0A0B2WN53_METAS|nr:uncharacterized protein MAM_07756 [Metarhizium album ARSEF 1941]KHN94440.1 hypothetical protein MAM_07756 [Metarhizium album ARSEF 1941]